MPLLYLNLAGLAAGAVWLGMQGQWQVIWIGFIMIFFSPYVIPILVMPAGIFSHFMALYHAKQRAERERAMFFMSLASIVLFLTFWCTGVFEYVTHSVTSSAMGAGLLWACASALTPLLWWSSRDRANIFIITMVEVTQIAVIVLCATRLLLGQSAYWPSFAICCSIITAAAVAQAIYEEKFMNKTKEVPR